VPKQIRFNYLERLKQIDKPATLARLFYEISRHPNELFPCPLASNAAHDEN
jgi:hypothetical protein